MFQKHFGNTSRFLKVLQEYFRSTSGVLQEYFRSTSGVLQEHFSSQRFDYHSKNRSKKRLCRNPLNSVFTQKL
jgi:hypothetical protein